MKKHVTLSHGIDGTIFIINLQQGFILDSDDRILASYDSFQNKLIYNKPLIAGLQDILGLRHLKQVAFKNNLLVPENIKLIETDNFSIDYYKP